MRTLEAKFARQQIHRRDLLQRYSRVSPLFSVMVPAQSRTVWQKKDLFLLLGLLLWKQETRSKEKETSVSMDIKISDTFPYTGEQNNVFVFSYSSRHNSRVPDQNGISQACCIVEIYRSGPELSIYGWIQPYRFS